MKPFIGLALAAGCALAAASASAGPPGKLEDRSEASMRLAALVGSYSPTLSAAQKAVLTDYRAGKTDPKAANITVTASRIGCSGGAKDETAFACDLTFGAKTVHLTARPASQVFAALELVGTYASNPSTPFGRYAASASGISCTIRGVSTEANNGGADCSFTPAAGAAAAAAPGDYATPITVDDDSSLLVAALVGGYSPTLNAADKAALSHYLAGQPTLDAKLGAFKVTADKVICTSSDRTQVIWACDLTFGAKTVHLAGEAATELDVDLALTTLQGSVAMGQDEIGTAPLTCTIDPAAIAARTNGARCTLTAQ